MTRWRISCWSAAAAGLSGLVESSSIPDARTIPLLRDRLAQAGVGDQVSEQGRQQLLSQGCLARCGAAMDQR
jgi:IS5 family transposase